MKICRASSVTAPTKIFEATSKPKPEERLTEWPGGAKVPPLGPHVPPQSLPTRIEAERRTKADPAMPCTKMAGQIFITYRREDSSAWAGRLSDRLSNHFPSNQIFMDVDSIDLGEDFAKTIEETVGSCDLLIAVIGKGWLTATDEDGARRLDNPENFVRIEIATALERGIRVIPVLVDGASMPRSRDLPDQLQSLVRRQALQLSHDRFRTDSERLASAVERALEKTRAERREHEPSAKPQ